MKKTKVEARSTTTAEASRRTRKVSIGSSNLTEGMGCAVPADPTGGYDGGACGRHAERGEVRPDQQGRTRGSGTAVPEPRVRSTTLLSGPRAVQLPVSCSVSYTHLRAHETGRNLVCRLLL